MKLRTSLLAILMVVLGALASPARALPVLSERHATTSSTSPVSAVCLAAVPCTLRAAIEGASPGDEVLVHPGTYRVEGELTIPPGVIVRAAQKATPTLALTASARLRIGGTLRLVTVRGGDLRLEGATSLVDTTVLDRTAVESTSAAGELQNTHVRSAPTTVRGGALDVLSVTFSDAPIVIAAGAVAMRNVLVNGAPPQVQAGSLRITTSAIALPLTADVTRLSFATSQMADAIDPSQATFDEVHQSIAAVTRDAGSAPAPVIDYEGDARDPRPDIGADEIATTTWTPTTLLERWHEKANWSGGRVPRTRDIAVVPAGTPVATIDDGAAVGELQVPGAVSVVSGGALDVASAVTVAGTLALARDTAITAPAVAVTGVLDLAEDATVAAPETVIAGQLGSSRGVVTGSLSNTGRVAGDLRIAGDYTQGAAGHLQVPLGARLVVDGRASLAGSFGTEGPIAAPSFEVLRATTRVGAFAALQGLDGLVPRYESRDGFAVLRLLNRPEVEEPPAVTVSGRLRPGGMVRRVPGSFAGRPEIAVAVRWLRCTETCQLVPGATGSEYTLTAADAGTAIAVEEVATNEAGSAVARSARTARVRGALAAPEIEAGPGEFTPGPVRFRVVVEAGAGVLCTVDGRSLGACPGAPDVVLGDLDDGAHTVEVTQVGEDGERSEARRLAFVLDTIAAPPSLSGVPVDGATARDASIGLAGEEGARFECQTDGRGVTACASPLVLRDLGAGEHVVEVVQIDRAGNRSGVARAAWTIAAGSGSDGSGGGSGDSGSGGGGGGTGDGGGGGGSGGGGSGGGGAATTPGDGGATTPQAGGNDPFGPVGATVIPSPAPRKPAAAKTCLSRRVLVITLRRNLRPGGPPLPRSLKGARFVKAQLLAQGRGVGKVRTSRRQVIADFRGLPNGVYTLKLTIRLKGGRIATAQRTYRTCASRLPSR